MVQQRRSQLGGCVALFVALLALPISAHAEWTFIRGDANGDGVINIADVIFDLNVLFSQESGNCHDARDANDDGSNDIADTIFILDFLFSVTGNSPSAPWSDCGTDPTTDALDCTGPVTSCPELIAGCTTNSDCPAGEFCRTATGNCGGTGDCLLIPFICTLQFDPVCGCDGTDYTNECLAWAAGTSVDFSGMCP